MLPPHLTLPAPAKGARVRGISYQVPARSSWARRAVLLGCTPQGRRPIEV